MPTVTYSEGGKQKKKKFPYTAQGQKDAKSFAKANGGKVSGIKKARAIGRGVGRVAGGMATGFAASKVLESAEGPSKVLPGVMYGGAAMAGGAKVGGDVGAELGEDIYRGAQKLKGKLKRRKKKN